MIEILLKIIIKDIIFEKKKHEILLQGIYFLQNIKNVSLDLKKEREVIKEKRKLV